MKQLFRLLPLFAGAYVAAAYAQDYPNKAINFIVGFPPGGGADIVARMIGQKLSENWSQPVVVVNKPGADSIIGYESASQAQPDGYTILLVTTELAINPSLYSKLPYDTEKDFTAVSIAASAPYVLVTHPALPVTTVKALISLAKARPGELTYASSGTGVYLASELFKSMARIDMLRVPYKGGPQAVSDVIAGQVSLMFPSMPTGYPHVKSGKVKALAITGNTRSPVAPALPTMAESGLPGYEAKQWWGVVTRTGTPSAIVRRLNSEIVKIVRMQDVVQRLGIQGVEAEGSTPEQFSAYIRAEINKWSKVAKDAGAHID